MGKEKAFKRLAEIEEICRITREIIEEMPNLPYEVSASQYGIYVEIPYDFEILAEVRRKLGNVWIPRYEFAGLSNVSQDSDNGMMYRSYRHREHKIELSLVLSPVMEGAKCEVVQVGEVTKPVYRAVCK